MNLIQQVKRNQIVKVRQQQYIQMRLQEYNNPTFTSVLILRFTSALNPLALILINIQAISPQLNCIYHPVHLTIFQNIKYQAKLKSIINSRMSIKQSQFTAKKDHYDFTIQQLSNYVHIQANCPQNFTTFIADVDNQYIKQHKNLQFFFGDHTALFAYLEHSFSDVQFTKNGSLQFDLSMSFGCSKKIYECKIDTVRVQLDADKVKAIKLNKFEAQLIDLKAENEMIKQVQQKQSKQQIKLKQQLSNCEKTLTSKDQIINTIFDQIKEFNRWKDQNQKIISSLNINSNKFIPDDLNPHFKKFIQIGNRIKKITGGSWDTLINKVAIDKTIINRYNIKQIKAGPNGSFMYGFGTQLLKGMSRAQDSKEFIGYYQNTGGVYEQGGSKKGGLKIKDGATITIQIDPKEWKVIWIIDGKKQSQANIGLELRNKSIYLMLVVYNQDSQFQLIQQ